MPHSICDYTCRNYSSQVCPGPTNSINIQAWGSGPYTFGKKILKCRRGWRYKFSVNQNLILIKVDSLDTFRDQGKCSQLQINRRGLCVECYNGSDVCY